MRSRLIIAIIIGCLTVAPLHTTNAMAEDAAERLRYKIKTAFLFNFAKFVDWPTSTFDSHAGTFTIGILAAPKLVPAASMLTEKSVKGSHVKIIIFNSLEELIPCHILFIGMVDKAQLNTIITKFEGLPVLTVADTAGFASLGGVINFITVDDTIRFEINPTVAATKNLKISSRLLSLARIVTSPKSKGEKR